MKKYFFLIIAIIHCLKISSQNITTNNPNGSFQLVYNNQISNIYIDTNDYKVISISANAFSGDIELITSKKPIVTTNSNNISEYPIIIGTVGKSKLINELISKKKLNIELIKDKWESFLITTIDNPFKGSKKALVIVGSDRRGTAFGVFELSKMLGVSPWVWWADVLPKHQDNILITLNTTIMGPPSVKYRGIFLNDEDWGLKPWAAKNWDTDIKDIGPKTYAKIFELMLRLKANYLWPAMHDCTKAFYFYPENPKVADEYAIVIGSSHCEPILRNNVFEWKENFKNEYGFEPGEWRYDLNKPQIQKYWDDRARQSANYESVYTIGMRGIHDGSMPGPKDVNAKLKLLDTVIRDQRQILSKEIKRPANSIPQIFCPYKEVLTLYQRGLNLPDDVTIVWADDNHGYIRQLSTPEEQKRSGGSGVYYHLSYWGSPHDYLWLSSISPSLIAFEMTKAYQFGADRLWVINVGDIKPAELETEFAMDLAWNINTWTPKNAKNYAKNWAERTFGKEFSDTIADIKTKYYELAHAGKPEHLGMLTFTDEEMNRRLSIYKEIEDKADRQYSLIPERLKDAYFQLVFYPVKGASLMNQKIFYARKSIALAENKDATALEYAQKSKIAFEEIQLITQQYNESIVEGKWNGMMSWNPRNLEVYKMPKVATQEMLVDTGTSKKPGINKPYVIIIASDFYKKENRNGYTIDTFNELGLDGRGIGILPVNANPIKNDIVNNAPFVEYKTHLNPGEHTITVKCLPTHSIFKGRDVRYSISVNSDSIQNVSVNASAESATWKKNVLRGYSEGITKHSIKNEGECVIRIYLPEPGTIINRIEIE
jgi:hypothetical protein